MSRFIFTMRLTVAEGARTTTTAPPSSRVRELLVLDEHRPPSSRVRKLLDEQRPRKMIDNMALIIIDQTYSALLEILGPEAPPSGDGLVQISRPVDPADPESPVLSVNASATHCCISLTDSLYGGVDGPDYANATSPKQSSSSQYRLVRATITASPGTLHLARVDGGGWGDYWACADVQPADVANKGLLGVLETIKARLDAAIRLEDTLLRMAKSSGCRSTKIREVIEVREALEKMRAAVDLDAIMRRRCRRLLIQEEIACRPEVDQACDADVLAKRLSTLHVGQKRGCPVHEVSYHRLPEPDDAEVLTKKLKALHV